MDYLKIVYKILKILRDMLLLEEPDYNVISAEALGVPVPLWSSIMEDLETNGYIKGVAVLHTFDARYPKIYMIETKNND